MPLSTKFSRKPSRQRRGGIFAGALLVRHPSSPHLFRQDLKTGNTDAVKADRAVICDETEQDRRADRRQLHRDKAQAAPAAALVVDGGRCSALSVSSFAIRSRWAYVTRRT